MLAITFTVPIPPTTNHLYTTGSHGRRVLSTEGRAYKGVVQLSVIAAHVTQGQHLAFCDASSHFALTIRLWFKDRRRRDISNVIKCLEDGIMEALGVDDCNVERILVARMGVADQDPRCEVTLEVL